jgi:hypothetical protein
MVRSDDLRVQIALMDRDGNQVKSTLARSNLRTVNIADRPHFRAQLDPSHDDLYISNPVVGRGSGAQTIQFTRKVLDSDGNFDGIAVLSLGCAELSSFYDTSEVGDGFVSLLTSEGVLLARGPSEPGIIGKSVAGEPDFQSLLKNSSGSLWWRNSSGSKRIISYRHVRGYPLLVEVAFNNDRIFRQYWYSVEHYVVTGLVATTVILLIGGFWVQQRRRTLVSGRALSLTLANMSQGIALIDARGSLPVINDHALKLLNMPTKDRASEAGGQAAVRRIRDLINSSSEGAYVADDKSRPKMLSLHRFRKTAG